MTKRGRLLVVEGLEGAGKSTAVHHLMGLLQIQGIQVITAREPGGTHVGETVRNLLKETDQEPLDPRTELLLCYAARVQLLERIIKPALSQGIWVVADRCELSSFAYQGGGRGIQLALLQQLSNWCVGTTQPDLLFYLDISPERGLQRAMTRGKLDRIEQEALAFFQAVHAAYRLHLPSFPSCVVIDAAQSLTQVQTDLEIALRDYLVLDHGHA